MEELGILDTEFVVSNAFRGPRGCNRRSKDRRCPLGQDGPKYTRLGEFRGLAPGNSSEHLIDHRL